MLNDQQDKSDQILSRLNGHGDGLPVLGGVLLKELLGEGGMGHVFLGFHTRLGIPVAVKVMKKQCESSLSYFMSEARITAMLDHPNLVRVFDVNNEKLPNNDSVFYMIMEYVPGRSARDALNSSTNETNHPLGAMQAVEIILNAAHALGAAHSEDIIHLDVKPDNILIRDADGTIKLTDLGLAGYVKDLNAKEQTGRLYGSIGYISPELLAGVDLGPEADVYALGASLFELIAGQLPFGSPDQAYLVRQMSEEPMDPRVCEPDLPDALVECIFKALENDPSKRPRDAPAFARMLEEILVDLPHGDPLHSSAAPLSPSSRQPLILCVDDQREMLEVIRDALGPAGFRSACFSSPVEALANLERLRPDAVLLDLNMPELDGLELYSQIRSMKGFETLPTLMMSAEEDSPAVGEALALGIADFLPKPLDLEELPIRIGLLTRISDLQMAQRSLEARFAQLQSALAGALSTPGQRGSTPSTPLEQPRDDEVVLIVDDEAVMRDLLKAFLEEDDYRVVEARDGREALGQVAMHRPDAVLMDVDMPNMDGLTACRQLRAGVTGRHTPILMLTSHIEPGFVDEAFRSGADDYLTKPISPAVLLCRLRAALLRSETAIAGRRRSSDIDALQRIHS